MSKMIVHGVKLTNDISSRKVLYEKNGKFFIRNGTDRFKRGKPTTRSYSSYFTQSGYRKMKEPLPAFRDSEEMLEGVTKFIMSEGGRVEHVTGGV